MFCSKPRPKFSGSHQQKKIPQEPEGEEEQSKATGEVDEAQEDRRDKAPPPGKQPRHANGPEECAEKKTRKERRDRSDIEENLASGDQRGEDTEPEDYRKRIGQRQRGPESELPPHVSSSRLTSSSSIGISERLPRQPEQKHDARHAEKHPREHVLHQECRAS